MGAGNGGPALVSARFFKHRMPALCWRSGSIPNRFQRWLLRFSFFPAFVGFVFGIGQTVLCLRWVSFWMMNTLLFMNIQGLMHKRKYKSIDTQSGFRLHHNINIADGMLSESSLNACLHGNYITTADFWHTLSFSVSTILSIVYHVGIYLSCKLAYLIKLQKIPICW